MPRLGLLTACLAIGLSAATASAAVNKSDSEISREILGSWIVPDDSSDATPTNTRIVETFRADGTYLTTLYSDAACTHPRMRAVTRWRIRNGVMLNEYADGSRSRDEIVGIDAHTLTLHSLDDGTTYTRRRATTCARVGPAI